MCGIAGLIGEGLIGDSQTHLAQRAVRRMMDSLALRGPDAEGLQVWPGAVLGHRRLSIFDLSPLGNQPMLSEDRQVGLVFNGAIYNFLELRRELESAGFSFRSRSDTEVLVHGYRHWGMQEMLPKLRGMFAIGLWDAKVRKCILVRDRLGVKPLLYAEMGNRLAFASTARALHDTGFAPEIDEDAVAEFLEFGYVTDDRCIYKDVRKVPAGGWIEWQDGQLRESSYWSLPSVDVNSRTSFEEAVERTESIFLESVKFRLEADVKVGALLSAGVDSSLVCWAIAKLGGNIGAFTVGTPNDPMDESADATLTAKKLGIPHQIISVQPDDAPSVDELVSAYGEPFACASALGMLRVSKAVKHEATVLLTGDGGDDIFLGYPEHKHFWMAQQLANKLPDAAMPVWQQVRKLLPQSGNIKRAKHFLDYATGGIGALANVHDGLPLYWRNGLLGDRMRDRNVSQRGIRWSHASAKNLLSEFLQYDRTTRFTGEYMTKVDGGAMRHAVEARSPFLDHELWEFAGSLPFSLRLHNGKLKAVLRELARRKIGERVATGAKKGFSIPVRRWLAGKWGVDFQNAMMDSCLEKAGIIQSGRVLDFWKARAQSGEVPNQLWYLFVLETWLKRESRSVAEPQTQEQVSGV
jgi:asparagine synthase (glutamine-hydrolysing)